MQDELIQRFQLITGQSLNTATFIKLSLGNYRGTENGLKQIIARPVIIKRENKLSFTYRYKTKDIIKNYGQDEGLILLVAQLQHDFRIATLFTEADEYIFEYDKKGKLSMRMQPAQQKASASLHHNREKKRAIAADTSFLKYLGLADQHGEVFKHAQDKFRQINHYISQVEPLLKDVGRPVLKVADMGSGKGYLTFALYAYLSGKYAGIAVTGVEMRDDLVKICNQTAKAVNYEGLDFISNTIQDYPCEAVDLLIALHACDTATDDAIAKGINAGASLIMAAPCCHKQIRREMEKHKGLNELDFLTKYGIFLERQAEMVTDGIRALILNYFGYKTKVSEFISDAHTPKNVLISGIKKGEPSAERKAEIKAEIQKIKHYFGISYHHLEKLMMLNEE